MSKLLLGTYLDFVKAGDNELLQAQAISGKSREVLAAMPLPDLAKIIDGFKTLITKSTKRKLYEQVTLAGKKFSFHPNLDYLTYQEYLDITTLLKDFPQSLPSILAILYRPKTIELGTKYKIEDYDAFTHLANAELFRDMELETVNGVMLFFYHLRNDCIAHTLDYLETTTAETLAELETIATQLEQETKA